MILMNVLMEMVAVHRNATTDKALISAAVEMDSHSLLTELDALMWMNVSLLTLTTVGRSVLTLEVASPVAVAQGTLSTQME